MPPPRKSSKIVLGCLVVLFGLAALAAGSVVVLRSWGNQPQLTRQAWSQAQQQWQRSGPANYDITVRVTGRRPATYFVEVRGGTAQSALLDGKPISQKRLFSIWSVPGMFSTLDRELILREGGGNAPAGAPEQMQMYCQWNETYGYPQEYQRHAVGQDDIGWKVTDFTSLSANTP